MSFFDLFKDPKKELLKKLNRDFNIRLEEINKKYFDLVKIERDSEFYFLYDYDITFKRNVRMYLDELRSLQFEIHKKISENDLNHLVFPYGERDPRSGLLHTYPEIDTNIKIRQLMDKYKRWDLFYHHHSSSGYLSQIDTTEKEQKIREDEEKEKKDIERRKSLAAKFHYFKLANYDTAYLYDYYPKNRYPYVDSRAESDRKSIWDFKNGNYAFGFKIVSDFLDGNYTKEQLKGLTFCVIPASTKDKNIARYKTLCEKISEKFLMQNGFNLISIREDRNNSREQKRSNTIENLSFSSVYGKNIILFDDITTRGTSFTQVADALKIHGAKSVRGLFLGKTVK